MEKTELKKESYSKRTNILIYGIEEDSVNLWKSYQQTANKFANFLETLKLNPVIISIMDDIHHLP